MIGIRLHVETVARRARCALCVHTAAGAREVHSIMARSHLMCDEGGVVNLTTWDEPLRGPKNYGVFKAVRRGLTLSRRRPPRG